MWSNREEKEGDELERSEGAGAPRLGRGLVDIRVGVQVVAGELRAVRGQRRVVVVTGDVFRGCAERDRRLDAGVGGDERK